MVIVKQDETAAPVLTSLPVDPALELGDEFGDLQRIIPYNELLYRDARDLYQKAKSSINKK